MPSGVTGPNLKSPYRKMILDSLPGTQKEIANKLNIGIATVCRHLKNLVDSEQAYVYKLRHPKHGGPLEHHYKAGAKPYNFGLKIPKKIPDKERCDAYRKRIKSSDEYADILAKKRADYWKKRTPKPDPLNALFGK